MNLSRRRCSTWNLLAFALRIFYRRMNDAEFSLQIRFGDELRVKPKPVVIRLTRRQSLEPPQRATHGNVYARFFAR